MTESVRSQEIAQWMERQIREGTWRLNSRIPTETELSAALGAGRSTIREATRVLVNNGMLESARGRGTFVRARSAVNSVLSDYFLHQPVPHLLGLRRALEVEAAGLAALHRSGDDVDRLRRSLEPGPSRGTAPDLPCAGSAEPGVLPSPGSFHADVFAAAGNPLLTELYQCAIVAVRRALAEGALTAGTAEERDADHRRVFEAIRAGDADAARDAAADHADRDFTVVPRIA